MNKEMKKCLIYLIKGGYSIRQYVDNTFFLEKWGYRSIAFDAYSLTITSEHKSTILFTGECTLKILKRQLRIEKMLKL